MYVYVHFQSPLITKRIVGLFRAIYETNIATYLLYLRQNSVCFKNMLHVK